MNELVVLVSEANEPIGTMPKALVHTGATPRHRAFSSYLTNGRGEVLLQRRALSKKTWPGIWSASCCGHPYPDESNEAAVRRRIGYELGITELSGLACVLPDFRYRCEMDGVVENEICPVFFAHTDQLPDPNPEEVSETMWLPWPVFIDQLAHRPDTYAPWVAWEIGGLSLSGFSIAEWVGEPEGGEGSGQGADLV